MTIEKEILDEISAVKARMSRIEQSLDLTLDAVEKQHDMSKSIMDAMEVMAAQQNQMQRQLNILESQLKNNG